MYTPASPLVQAALLLDRLSTAYQVRLSPEECAAFLERAERYNAMQDMETLTGRIDALIPRLAYPPDAAGRPNPNHGRKAHEYRVGNAGSRVLEVRVLSTYAPGLDAAGLRRGLQQLAQQHGADTFRDLSDPLEHAFLLGWD